jgi:catechol 2,3-dioxygenase-like lactoylglutathione lyase family enzyme
VKGENFRASGYLKESFMRTVFVFVVGILVGTAIQSAIAQGPRPNLRLNHVGISVKDLGEALKFYQEKLGFNEVVRNPNGRSAYIQVSRDTFLELQANPDQPAGQVTHFGMETNDIKTTVGQLRQRGLTVSDPGAPSAFTGGILANVNDPVYGRIELSEQPPGGKLRAATEAWKN